MFDHLNSSGAWAADTQQCTAQESKIGKGKIHCFDLIALKFTSCRLIKPKDFNDEKQKSTLNC